MKTQILPDGSTKITLSLYDIARLVISTRDGDIGHLDNRCVDKNIIVRIESNTNHYTPETMPSGDDRTYALSQMCVIASEELERTDPEGILQANLAAYFSDLAVDEQIRRNEKLDD
jgi:hypothetical protein